MILSTKSGVTKITVIFIHLPKSNTNQQVQVFHSIQEINNGQRKKTMINDDDEEKFIFKSL